MGSGDESGELRDLVARLRREVAALRRTAQASGEVRMMQQLAAVEARTQAVEQAHTSRIAMEDERERRLHERLTAIEQHVRRSAQQRLAGMRSERGLRLQAASLATIIIVELLTLAVTLGLAHRVP